MNEAFTAVSDNSLLVRCSTAEDKEAYLVIVRKLVEGTHEYATINDTLQKILFFASDHMLDVMEVKDQDTLTFKIVVVFQDARTDDLIQEQKRIFDEQE